MRTQPRRADSTPQPRGSGIYLRDVRGSNRGASGAHAAPSVWRPTTLAPLLFAAGACSAVSLAVLARELRQQLGGSSRIPFATAAVFCFCFGLGARWWSKRLETSNQPVRAYASLQLLVTLSIGPGLWLLSVTHSLYVGAIEQLGLTSVGTASLRLCLLCMLLGLPAWLTGGTLPAVSRAVEPDGDVSHSGSAYALGWSLLGAAIGCAATGTALLARLGDSLSFVAACVGNGLVSVAAYALAARATASQREPMPETKLGRPARARASDRVDALRGLTLLCGALLGMVCAVVATVQARMLPPLLGDSLQANTLPLAIALGGCALGSLAYARNRRQAQASALGFALLCTLQAVSLAATYAWADVVAQWAALIRVQGSLGEAGLVLSWLQVAGLTLLAPAVLLGIQLPSLMSLMRRRQPHVTLEVGAVLSAFAVGVSLAALAAWSGWIYRVSLVESWRWSAGLICCLGLVVGLLSAARSPRRRHGVWLPAGALFVGVALTATGPSAFARHGAIGAGAVPPASIETPNKLTHLVRRQRHAALWDTDGIEHTLGIARFDDLTYIVDGVPGGHVRRDAPTEVMAGLLGAALHPRQADSAGRSGIRRALVLGLGDGTTAGWLARIPEIARVDVAEPEPALLELARLSNVINLGALDNPKLQIHTLDASTVLAAPGDSYDLIVASAPYAQASSLVATNTHEHYMQLRARLAPEGLFVQRVRAGHLDSGALRTVYATLLSAFPHVETWHGLRDDLLLVAALHPLRHDAERLRARLAAEPLAAALRVAWHTEGAEGFVSHFVANAAFARATARDGGVAHIGDKPWLDEARSNLSVSTLFGAAEQLIHAARTYGADRPQLVGGQSVDWARVAFEREAFSLLTRGVVSPSATLSAEYSQRLAVLQSWAIGELSEALRQWNALFSRQPLIVPHGVERVALAELIAHRGDSTSFVTIRRLINAEPTLALAFEAVWLANHGAPEDSTERILLALHQYRDDPWPLPAAMGRSIQHLGDLHQTDRVFAASYLRALSMPFAAYVNDEVRERTAMQMGLMLGPEDAACLELLLPNEPHSLWTERALRYRLACYTAHGNALRARAQAELDRFTSTEPTELLPLLQGKHPPP